MTPEQARQMVADATPGPWRLGPWPNSGDAALIALAPEVMALLADAMEHIECIPCERSRDGKMRGCDYGDGPIEHWCDPCRLLARFAEMGDTA